MSWGTLGNSDFGVWDFTLFSAEWFDLKLNVLDNLEKLRRLSIEFSWHASSYPKNGHYSYAGFLGLKGGEQPGDGT